MLRRSTRRQIGILLDTYHLWDDPDVLPWIAANAGRIVGVHVADWPAPDRADRVLPGKASAASASSSRPSRRRGWDGALDVEIFSTPELFWGLPVDEAARRAHDAAVALLPQEPRPPRTRAPRSRLGRSAPRTLC